MSSSIKRTRRRAGFTFASLPLLAAACSDQRRVATDAGPARLQDPLMPTQAPTGTQTQVPNIPPNVPGDVQDLTIVVRDGAFDRETYIVQAGAVRLRVSAGSGGPYSMRIEELLQARVVGENTTTVIGLTAWPGRYTMQLNAGVLDTAVLEVRPPGGVPGTTPR